MHCSQCGQLVPDTSRFCNACGAETVAVVQTAQRTVIGDPAVLADEREVFTIRPTMIFVLIRYVIAALVLIATAAIMGVLSSKNLEWMNGTLAFIVILAVGLIAFANPIYHHILRRREVYTLTNHKLEMRYGIIAKTVRNIPLSKVQDVTVKSSVWQRLMNLGDLEIDSASETGKIILDDIHHPERYADQILAELRRRN